MKTLFKIAVILSSVLLLSCKKDGEKEPAVPAAPGNVTVEQTGSTSAKVTWQDNSNDETGFVLYLRDSDDLTNASLAGRTGANETTFTIDGLKSGHSYYFGVSAENSAGASEIVYTLFHMEDLSTVPFARIIDVKSRYCSVTVRYTIGNVEKTGDVSYGLAFGKNGNPTIEDGFQNGPQEMDSKSIFQVLPSFFAQEADGLHVRAFVRSGKSVRYSEDSFVKFPASPTAISLDWKKTTPSGFPSGIDVFETTSQLEGRNFHAWYAIADNKTGEIDFKVNVPSSATVIDEQAKAGGKCLVLTNGGYFYNGRHTGIAVSNGSASGSVSQVRGSLRTSDPEYNVMYNVTRGIFGTDDEGKASVYWAGTDASGATWYFDRPMPSVRGENKYGPVSSESPSAYVAWKPQEALSAGPVLLKDGHIAFDFSTTEKGGEAYLDNFEIMPYDIFGPEVVCDRTVAGVTASGKVIIFICDGRIGSSKGATLLEVARIMKGLGCTDAVNFDGGGSTGMIVDGKHVNDVTPNNRPVVSTMGFYRK